MIYPSSHRAPTMSSARKTSPRPQHRNPHGTTAKSSSSSVTKGQRGTDKPTGTERCRGRCRVQWSEKHVKEGLVLVQEAQLARVVKTGPISEHYEIDAKPFASGQWARVYRCRSRSTGILYAAKYSSRSRFNADCSAELRHEIALLSLCSQSPRVVKLHDVYETPKEIILVMEYAPGGDLQTLIDGDLVPLEGDVVNFVRQLAEGLAYLHERNIAHLDIKPQNLVMMGTFPECDVKLCDFEISRVVLEGTEVREILGTPDYVAPEILHYEPITLAADMWSLGVTTYVLLTGFSPFGGETDQETFQNISLGEVDFPEELFEDVSTQAKDFVARLLVPDPSARMTAKQCLRHDWLRGAPTQASPHLRRYLSKSREVLLERVVSRENLRRAALLSQAKSHANLSETNENQGLGGSLSQSEMCLSYGLMGSQMSLPGSEDGMSPADSQTSLESSQNSIGLSHSCLLNKEQTQGLLNQAQSKSQANLNHGSNRGLLTKMRNLNKTQSQACLLVSNKNLHKHIMNPLFSRSREKLYGLKSLSKSQGVLDIYRSLECVKKKKNQRAGTEDMLPIFKRLNAEIAASNASLASFDRDDNTNIDFGITVDDDDSNDDVGENQNEESKRKINEVSRSDVDEPVKNIPEADGKPEIGESDSFDVVGQMKDTVDEDERDTNELELKTPDHRYQDGDRVHEQGSVGERSGDSLEDKSEETETKVPEKPEGATEYLEVPKSPSYDSEENLDSLQSVESDTLTEDSDETPTDQKSRLSVKQPSQRQNSDISSHSNNSVNSDDKDENSESENDEPKYTVAQLVSAFNKHQEVASQSSLEAIMCEKRVTEVNFPTGPKALRLFIPDISITESTIVRRKTSYKPRKNWEELRKQNEKNEGVLKKDFDNDSGNEEDNDGTDGAADRATDRSQDTPRTEEQSIEELIVSADKVVMIETSECSKTDSTTSDTTDEPEQKFWQTENTRDTEESTEKTMKSQENSEVRIVEKYKQCVDGVKSVKSDTNGKSTKEKFVKPTGAQPRRNRNVVHSPKERVANYIFPEVTVIRKEDKRESSSKITASEQSKTAPKIGRKDVKRPKLKVDNTVNLKDILQKVDSSQTSPRENLENLRKRTSITKIILNDNAPPIDNDSNNNGDNSPIHRAKSEPPSIVVREDDRDKLDIPPPSFVRSASLSSESSCPTSSSIQSDIGMSWEDVRKTRGSSTSLEKEENRVQRRAPASVDSKRASSTSLEERRTWGKVCTGSYTRAMEKFNGKSAETNRKSINSLTAPQQSEKTRRKSSPAMPQFINP